MATTTTAAPTRGKINLKGSVKMVTEFFDFSINSILFQRALYPPEDFKMVKKYGLNMLVTNDDRLQSYLKNITKQLETWLMAGKVSKLVLAIISKDSMETLERWQFDIHVQSQQGKENQEPVNRPTKKLGTGKIAPPSADIDTKTDKSEKEIHAEIQAIIRQITASVTFLPQLEGRCVFNILIYTDKDAEVPTEWIDSDPHMIKDAEQVKLRSFSTNVHKVDALVAYRLDDQII